MSAYPPPPPPYDRSAARAQQRAYRDQLKFQRAALRTQHRARRRRSILGPLFLLGLGVVFLLAQIGRLPWGRTLDWFATWWPAVLIVAGFILLAEWFLDHNRTDANGLPLPSRSIGGGVITLLIFVAFLGLASRAAVHTFDWTNNNFGNFRPFDHMFGERHDFDDSLTSAIGPSDTLTIRNGHGDVSITGTSEDGQVHVSVHKQVYAWKNSDIADRDRRLQPTLTTDGAHSLILAVAAVDGGQSDLSIQVPRSTAVNLTTTHGDIDISSMHAALTITINHGDVSLSAIDGPVAVHLNNDHGSLTARNLTGDLTAEGRGGDLQIESIAGALSLDGDFFGDTNIEHITGRFRFHSSRTQFDTARLDGSFDISGEDLTASDLLGPVTLITHNRNITLDRAQGPVTITNRNGTVNVSAVATPPASSIPAGISPITIHNERGSVDLGLPATGGFLLAASTRHGDIENDFNLTPTGDDSKTLRGAIAGGTANISVDTTDGDVTIRKITLAPLPPAPPTSPRFTAAPSPPTPAPPTPPTSPKKLPKPTTPAKPTPPSDTF